VTDADQIDRACNAAHALALDDQGSHLFVCEQLAIPPQDRDVWREPIALRMGALRAQQATTNGHASIEFVSWHALHQAAPDEPGWVWQGYVARNAITMAAGKPKAGKSTLVCALSEAVDAGAATFLSRPITGGPVIYVSEEAGVTLKPKLPPSTESRVLTRDQMWPRPGWGALVEAIVAESREIDAVLLVIDSYVFWAQLAEGQENDASINQQMIASLVEAANAGLAVILVHHHRKSGGEGGDAVRGSGGIFAAVDALLEVERIEKAPPRQRQLVATGRWPHMAPVLIVDHDEATGAWGVVGQADDRQHAGTMHIRQALLELLPIAGAGLTNAEIEEETGMHKLDYHEHLTALVKQGLVGVKGRGVKGDPHRHHRELTTPDEPQQTIPEQEG
jgi:hypothetical protein